eukprot:6171109-Amphidinium_carterae.8
MHCGERGKRIRTKHEVSLSSPAWRKRQVVLVDHVLHAIHVQIGNAHLASSKLWRTMGRDGESEEEVIAGTEAFDNHSNAQLSAAAPVKGKRGRKPGQKNAATAAGSSSGKKDKTFKKCRACGAAVSSSGKSVWCDNDKRALDRLRALSKAKGESSWFSDQMRDESKAVSLLTTYWSAMGGRKKYEGWLAQ